LTLCFVTTLVANDYAKAPEAIKALEELQELTPFELDSDWHLDRFFGHIKIISSKDSPRFPLLLEKMQEVGLNQEQFELSPTIAGDTLPESLWQRVPAWASEDPIVKQKIAGCTMAHYYLIKNTRDRYQEAFKNYRRLQSEPEAPLSDLEAAKNEVAKYSSVLIMEDNNAFGSLKNGAPTLEGMGKLFRETLKELPADWDMFYFICMHGDYDLPLAKEVPETSLLLKASYGVVTKCFAVKASSYDSLVALFEAHIFPELNSEVAYWTGTKLSTMVVTPTSISKVEIGPSDHMVALLHKNLNVYIAKEPLSYRFASTSLAGSPSPGSGIIFADHNWQPKPH
jgi:hypothetical protein